MEIVKFRYLPLYIWLVYSLLTILLFYFGPYEFESENLYLLFLFLVLVHIALVRGYLKGINRSHRYIDFDFSDINKILNYLAVPNILYIILIFLFLKPSSDTFEDVALLRDDFNKNVNGSIYGHLSVVFGSMVIPYVSITIINFKRIEKKYLLLTLFLCIAIIFNSISFGKRAGIYSLITLLTISFIASYNVNYASISRNFKILFISLIAAIFSFFLVYSSIVVNSTGHTKEQVKYIMSLSLYETVGNEITLKDDQALFESLPDNIAPAYLAGSFYFSHGYYGLCKSLSVDKPLIAFGTAHSDVINRTIAWVFSADFIKESSYFNLLIESYNYPSSFWITLYSWIASDVGFIGTIFIFYLLGHLLGHSWISAIKSFNPYACSLLAWLFVALMLVHFGFNDDYGSFISFYGSIWCFFNISKSSEV